MLGRGLISGRWQPGAAAARGDIRAVSPRFQAGNVEANLRLVEALRTLAQQRGITVAQLAIAWVLSRGADIVPLVGARRREQLSEALGSIDVSLSAADLQALEAAIRAIR